MTRVLNLDGAGASPSSTHTADRRPTLATSDEVAARIFVACCAAAFLSLAALVVVIVAKFLL